MFLRQISMKVVSRETPLQYCTKIVLSGEQLSRKMVVNRMV